MTHTTFLLSKDPETEHGGDMAMARVLMAIAREQVDEVTVICLSSAASSSTPGMTRVPKPRVDPVRLLVGSARKRMSLCHVRYDVPELTSAIDGSDADVYVAVHSYMAEAFLASGRRDAAKLTISSEVSESLIWRLTRGMVGRMEAPRIERDELRVASAATLVGTYDRDEVDRYRARGVDSALWLDLTFPADRRLDLTQTAPRLVFMGTRTFPPNEEAFGEAVRLWPRISAGIPDAELCIIGEPAAGGSKCTLPPGVRDLGFVDDLHAFLGTCRAMIAPIRTGGGVRVKILDAASKGLPIVGTPAGVGSLGPVLDVAEFGDDAGFIDQCRRYLLDRDAAVRDGSALFDVNAQRWEARIPHAAVERLVTARR
ncbi:glycosyltransferase family 4 protein [Williamsia sp.]|uniref:glycosyltransferase n=1 Tax=Williamsia sp. TaxID=1872085 RepID=UPI001A335EA4|nr:glycosyltransferase family 4 protein [Williamsia sp.]MBJ7289140.1 glycosyltransferase [Williamsia sp.]